MGHDLRSAIRPSLVMLVLFTLLTGLAYPALLTGIAQTVFAAQANGSLVRNGDTVVGSELIGQSFTAPKYFHGRPSAAGKGYDGTASGGSNLGPAAKALIDRVTADLKTARSPPTWSLHRVAASTPTFPRQPPTRRSLASPRHGKWPTAWSRRWSTPPSSRHSLGCSANRTSMS